MKYKHVRQYDATDCAAACLAMVCLYYKKETTITKLRDLMGTDLKGTTLIGLSKCAEQLGFESSAVRVDREGFLSDYTLPCIANVVTQKGLSQMEYIIDSTKTKAGTRKIPMTEDVYETFRRILKERPRDLPEKMVDGYIGFLFRDKNGMPEVAMHWQHRFNHAVKRYNDIFKIQMPNITPHVCRHTYCSNQARAGMNPKTLQYLMGHSEIGVTMNTYTHLGLDDAKDEMIRLEELEQARKEIDKTNGIKPMKQNMFKAI